MANVYIRDGASGSGTSWSDALDQLPATLIRGNTYYIADGNYPTYTFNDAVSGTTVITIKKASASDHGTETGWNSAYGDGQATWGGITFATSYFVFDGAYRNENDWEEVGSYGFNIVAPDRIDLNNSVGNITIKYVDVGYPNGTVYPTATGRAINATLTGTPWRSNLYIGYCHLHNMSTCIYTLTAGDSTLEYCYMGPTSGKEMWRHEMGHNWIVRYNKFIDGGMVPNAEGQTAMIGIFNHTGGNVQSDGWEVYGNVFGGTGTYTLVVSNGLTSINIVNDWKFYHNVISHVDGAWCGAIKIGGTNNQVRNCLWYWMGNYDANWGGIIEAVSADYSWYYYKNTKPARLGANGSSSALAGIKWAGTEDPFVDEPNKDYRIKASFTGTSPKDKATNVGSPYNIDANGVQHDNIGAFATIGESGGDTSPPVITSASIPSAGTTLVANTNETVVEGSGGDGGFTVSASGGAVTVSNVVATGSAITLTLSRTINNGETITWSYTQPGNGIEDSAGNDLVTFSGQSVTNNSTQGGTQVATPSFSPPEGTFAVSTLEITITSATSGSTIHYTIDGTTPDIGDPSFATGGSFVLLGTTTVKAIAVKNGNINSDVVEGFFELTGNDSVVPTLESASISIDGIALILNFSEPVVFGAGGNGGISLISTLGNIVPVFDTANDVSTLIYVLNRVIHQGETLLLNYTQPGNGIEDSAGNDLANISNFSVTNSSLYQQKSKALNMRSISGIRKITF